MQNFCNNILKKNKHIHQFGKWFRRVVLHSKYPYFLKSTPRPLSNQYGFDRGTPLDRYYIETFLEKYKEQVQGICLEVHDASYIKRFGGSKVSTYDVLDIETDNPNATIIDDLRNLKNIPNNTYDCIILTQVFQFIDDLDAAVAETYRILAPQGVLLVTVPAVSRTDCISGPAGDYWRFTEAGVRHLFGKVFGNTELTTYSYGNARTGQFFLAGLAQEDVSKKLLNTHDNNFPVTVALHAQKS